MTPSEKSSRDASRPQLSPGTLLLIFAGFAVLCLGLYRDALSGSFVSDDISFIPQNPFVTSAGIDLTGVFDPFGDARFFVGGNYMPVPFLAHVVEWKLWGAETLGYHVVNVLLHALNATLLLVLLTLSGVTTRTALLAAAFFAIHAANVEAVAWISQLRTLLALGFSLAALISIRRHPLLSVSLFALGLLSKASAAFAWPMACALYWARLRRGEARKWDAAVPALWALVLLAFTPTQLTIFSDVASPLVDPYPDLATMIRSMTAIGARYLVMAATGYGTAAFHEPPPVSSNLDPWFLSGIALACILVWRIARSLRRGDDEAAWWIGAAASFAPISQILPFTFAMGDRYLYFILPGLIGGTLLAGRDLAKIVAQRPEESRLGPRSLPLLSRAAAVTTAGLLLALALQASGRAGLWVGQDHLNRDAMARYPDGTIAHYLTAREAAQERESDRALFHLRRFYELGGSILYYLNDGSFKPVRSDPRFEALTQQGVEILVARIEARGNRTQKNLRDLAEAHRLLGNLDRAIDLAEEGLRMRGRFQSELVRLRWQLLQERTQATR